MSDDNVTAFPARGQTAETEEQARARAQKPPEDLYPREISEAMATLDRWAVERLTAGQEPPWTWYRLMRLREALSGIDNGPI